MAVTEQELERLREQARERQRQLAAVNIRTERLRSIIMLALEQIAQERPLAPLQERLWVENIHPN